MTSIAISLAYVWLGAAALMVGLWILQRRTGNAGVVDVGWAAALGGSAVFLAFWLDGDAVRRAVVSVMGGLWGLRLALHIHHRAHGKTDGAGESRYCLRSIAAA